MTTQTSRDCPNRSISVIVPAHNEEASIGALLRGLVRDAAPGEISVVVACNGCTDRTAEIARTFGPSVTVLEIPAPSKRHAQRAGDAVARGFPRAYVDADVTTTLNDLRELAGRLEDGRILATAPARRLDTTGTDWVVTRYYRVWEQLPQVREGLFGRGVVMVSHAGAKRILEIPDVMSDDLAVRENRLRMLATIAGALRGVAKLELLEG